MPKVKFFLNPSGVRELLRGPEMSAIVQSAAQQVAAEAEGMSGGLPFDVDGGAGRNRVYATVKPGSIHAFHKTRKENILEKAKRSVKV
jgi:hypothetical protein